LQGKGELSACLHLIQVLNRNTSILSNLKPRSA
jgi:hypothetical protein